MPDGDSGSASVGSVLVLGSDFDVSSVSLILMGPPLIRTLLIPWSLDLYVINCKLY